MLYKGKTRSTVMIILATLMVGAPLLASAYIRPVKAQAVALKIIVTDQQKPGIDGIISDFLASPLGSGVASVDVIASGTRADDQLVYLVTQMTAGSSEFDVIGLDPIWVAQFAENGWIVELGPLLEPNEMNDYVDGMVDACTYKGKLWAYPYFMNLGMLYYRKDILARNGFNESNFDTWAELNATANMILDNVTEQAMNPDLVGYVGQFDAYEGGVVNFIEWIGSSGVTDIFDSNGMADINNTKVTQTMTFLKGIIAPRYTGVMNTSYIIPRSGLVMDEGSSVGTWLAGNAIFMRQWTFAYGSTVSEASLNATSGPGNYTQFGVAPLPTFTGAADEKSSCVGGAVLAIPETSAHQQAALNLTKFLGDLDAQLFELTNISNFPALKSAYSSLPSEVSWAADFLPAFNKTVARPVHPKYSSMSVEIADKFSSLISGAQPIPKALGDMESALNEIIAGGPTSGIPGYDYLIIIGGIFATVAILGFKHKRK